MRDAHLLRRIQNGQKRFFIIISCIAIMLLLLTYTSSLHFARLFYSTLIKQHDETQFKHYLLAGQNWSSREIKDYLNWIATPQQQTYLLKQLTNVTQSPAIIRDTTGRPILTLVYNERRTLPYRWEMVAHSLPQQHIMKQQTIPNINRFFNEMANGWHLALETGDFKQLQPFLTPNGQQVNDSIATFRNYRRRGVKVKPILLKVEHAQKLSDAQWKVTMYEEYVIYIPETNKTSKKRFRSTYDIRIVKERYTLNNILAITTLP